ncbi:MAG TPA: hypothetical protein VM099_16775 [Gemmatimonadaceae bacterium]|nr:hypothetical protein [Gemmatimonadaceae bacterium]
MSPKPVAVLVGFAAKSPVAGMVMYNLHYLAGLMELGYAVHYVECVTRVNECYNPSDNSFSDDPAYGLRYLTEAMTQMPSIATTWTFIDLQGNYHGASRDELLTSLDAAEFVLTIADPVWFDELERCPRRAFLDGDPMFTQVRMLDASNPTGDVLARYPTLFTYWTRQTAADTKVPSAGRTWISTTPAVATSLWEVAPSRCGTPVRTLMNWGGFRDVQIDGLVYGKKDRSVVDLIDMPSLTTQRLELAVGGSPPREELESHGWALSDPLDASGTIDGYREFIAGSRIDLGIAKHGYVQSRSGWVSDRSLCYLASGRPVIHQDTGFTDWLPSQQGLLAFSNAVEATKCIDEIELDYEGHARAARSLAETTFEARSVIGQMLDKASFR